MQNVKHGHCVVKFSQNNHTAEDGVGAEYIISALEESDLIFWY